jgi:N-acetylmuramoyl-L-alanine amidase
MAFAMSLSTTILAESPSIRIQYPKKGQRIPTVDSTFIFGEVTPGSKIEVNGQEISVHEQGGFLAFVEVEPGEFVFVLKATRKGETSTLEWPVSIADRYRAVPRDSLSILDAYHHPNVDQELVPGDLVEVSFRGTPGGTASFSIEGVVENVQMTESGLRYESVWGSEVFGKGAVEDSATVAGSYRGSIYVPDSAQVDSARVIFKLLVPASQIDSSTVRAKDQTLTEDGEEYHIAEDTARGRITVVRHEYPQVVELIDSLQTVRTGPRKGYLSIFQPHGIRFVCDGRYSNYLRLKLAPGQPAWVPDTSILFLPSGTPVPHSYISNIRCTGMATRTRIEVFLDEKLPFQVEEIPEKNRFVLRIFQATSDTDWIRYLGSGDLVERINWSQEQAGVYRLVIELKDHPRIWGWYGYFSGNVLTLDIKPGPEHFRSYKGLRIMIDPGHSKDPGAIGPTGLTEAEANLSIADRLASLLRKKGATVFMTRVDDSDVKLYDRPRMAVEKDCDIFISVHNNSVPDGVNPFVAHGASTYYYNAHSKPLADFVQDRLLKGLDAKDHGLYYANFAVTRPSQYVAILVECAFMILPEQEAALRTEAFQTKCASAIANGLDDYLRSLNKHQ